MEDISTEFRRKLPNHRQTNVQRALFLTIASHSHADLERVFISLQASCPFAGFRAQVLQELPTSSLCQPHLSPKMAGRKAPKGMEGDAPSPKDSWHDKGLLAKKGAPFLQKKELEPELFGRSNWRRLTKETVNKPSFWGVVLLVFERKRAKSASNRTGAALRFLFFLVLVPFRPSG